MAAASTIPVGHPALVQALEFSGVFKGRDLTRKGRRLSAGLLPVNALLCGGIPRGRISELIGRQSSGKTSLAASFVAAATQRGETAAIVDSAGVIDPESMAAAGVDLARTLWVGTSVIPRQATFSFSRAARLDRSPGVANDLDQRPLTTTMPALSGDIKNTYSVEPSEHIGETTTGIEWRRRYGMPAQLRSALRAAELVLEAGGFGLLVIDFGGYERPLPQSAALRVARLAERSGTSVLTLAVNRMCGTFAALGLSLSCNRTLFTRLGVRGPALFEGLKVEARVTRNKLGGSGASGYWDTLLDPSRGTGACDVPESRNGARLHLKAARSVKREK